MYVVRTAITAKTMAIKTAAVGRSMPFLRYAIRQCCVRRSLRSTLFGWSRVEQGRWSHALMPVVFGAVTHGGPFDSVLTGSFNGTIDPSISISTGGGDEVDTFMLSLGRFWIIRAFGRNPLARVSDRLEAVVLVLVFATALVVTPVAGAIGTAVYEVRARLYAEEAQTRHTVAATAMEDSTILVEQDVEAFSAQARWHANGVEHFGSVGLAHETKAGDQLDVWVDASGDQVVAPTPTWRAGIDAMFAGAGVWLIAMTGIAGLSVFVRSRLTRRRYSAWEREWRALVSDDGGRTGSQT